MEEEPPSSEEYEAVPIKDEPADEEFEFHQELESFGGNQFGEENDNQ